MMAFTQDRKSGPSSVLLEGVCVPGDATQDASRQTIQNLARDGRVAYRVFYGATPQPASRAFSQEQRVTLRRRTRLRSAKLLDQSHAFLCECLIRDRSSTGLRLQLMRNIRLPTGVLIWDDETKTVTGARVAWRRDLMLGVQLMQRDRSPRLRPATRAMLVGRYYAVR